MEMQSLRLFENIQKILLECTRGNGSNKGGGIRERKGMHGSWKRLRKCWEKGGCIQDENTRTGCTRANEEYKKREYKYRI